MGIAKKMEWLKWIRKYSTGILDTKTGSMETLIDSASSKTVNSNYAYASSVTADDECVVVNRHNSTAITTAAAAVTPKQRPMLPPPVSGESPPSTPTPPQSLPNDDYDCYISLDGIPIKQEFQYTLSADTDGCGKITKHDIEGLASKILESMYGTTMKFTAPGRRTVKVTLNVRQSASDVVDGPVSPPWGNHHHHHALQKPQRDRRSKSDHNKHRRPPAEPPAVDQQPCPVYVKGGSSTSHRVKQGAQRYRRDQLVEMVSRSLAENLSFQNQRKSNKPESYHRTRTKRRPNAIATTVAGTVVPSPPPPPSSSTKPVKPSKVAWSPYDFEPVTYAPPTLNELKKQHQLLYGNVGGGGPATVEEHVVKWLNQHAVQAAAVASPAKGGTPPAAGTPEEQQNTKNNQQRYKRAKLASKKIHHHIHEHHHYHHYDYYIV